MTQGDSSLRRKRKEKVLHFVRNVPDLLKPDIHGDKKLLGDMLAFHGG